jgi:hypothetical protein
MVPRTVPTDKPKMTGCDYNKYPQACAHYVSVTKVDHALETLYCQITKRPQGQKHPATRVWNNQHKSSWRYWVSRPLPGYSGNDDKCERDEYPPFHFMAPANMGISNYVQWIRWLPRRQNQDAGKYWTNVCPDKAKSTVNIQGGGVANSISTENKHITYMVNTFHMTPQNSPKNLQDDGLTDNPCLPTSLTDDVGFALLTNDV